MSELVFIKPTKMIIIKGLDENKRKIKERGAYHEKCETKFVSKLPFAKICSMRIKNVTEKQIDKIYRNPYSDKQWKNMMEKAKCTPPVRVISPTSPSI